MDHLVRIEVEHETDGKWLAEAFSDTHRSLALLYGATEDEARARAAALAWKVLYVETNAERDALAADVFRLEREVGGLMSELRRTKRSLEVETDKSSGLESSLVEEKVRRMALEVALSGRPTEPTSARHD